MERKPGERLGKPWSECLAIVWIRQLPLCSRSSNSSSSCFSLTLLLSPGIALYTQGHSQLTLLPPPSSSSCKDLDPLIQPTPPLPSTSPHSHVHAPLRNTPTPSPHEHKVGRYRNVRGCSINASPSRSRHVQAKHKHNGRRTTRSSQARSAPHRRSAASVRLYAEYDGKGGQGDGVR